MDPSLLNQPPGNWGSKDKDQQKKPVVTKTEIPPIKLPPGTPQMREIEIRNWNLNASECKTCGETIPHSQMSVCTQPRCKDAYQADCYATPTEFFNRVTMFCGKCTNTIHKDHRDFMKPALPLAIATSSELTGTTLFQKYKETAFLHQEKLVDFVMMAEFNTGNLEIPDFHNYLSTSTKTSEWNSKVELVTKFLDTLDDNRRAAMDYVTRLAKESVEAYRSLLNDIDSDVEKKRKEKEDFEFRQEEHRIKMKESDNQWREVEAWNAAHCMLNDVDQRSIAPSCRSHATSRSVSVTMPVSVRVEKFEEDAPHAPAAPTAPSTAPAQSAKDPEENNESVSDESVEEDLDYTQEISLADRTVIYKPPNASKPKLNGPEIFDKILGEYDRMHGSHSESEIRTCLTEMLDEMTDDAGIQKSVNELLKSMAKFSLHPENVNM